MPHVQKHDPGSFNWLELGTTDQAAAKQFYGALFGWEAQDFPMGPDGVYTMFKLDGKDVGACYKLGPQMEGIPPNWGLYVCVDDADATAKRAAELGGAVLKPPFDVYTFGRMAVLQDPTGAIITCGRRRRTSAPAAPAKTERCAGRISTLPAASAPRLFTSNSSAGS
jgi:predicted enzyme related to lactoylglutathione lyase